MKKVLKVFIPLLLVCTLTVALFSVIPSGAATTAEATLTVKPEGSAATTVSGSFQDMLERLSTVEPTVNTTYEIKLTSDAVHNEAVRIHPIHFFILIMPPPIRSMSWLGK